MKVPMSRRDFVVVCGAATGSLVGRRLAGQGIQEGQEEKEDAAGASAPARRKAFTILKSLKWNMVGTEGSVEDKFRLLKELGFDGVELDSPGGVNKVAAKAASDLVGLPIDGTVDSTHWQVRLTDPAETIRQQALTDLKTAIRETHQVGGHSVLLVPGHGKDGPQDEIVPRSQAMIRQALPLAAQLGIYIVIENVWNEMFYDKHGDNRQSADELARFIDELDSPWVGVQFDIGNHQKYGPPADWIRTLGKRIVKLDVKDWGEENGFCKIGDGDVDWASVRQALQDIRFSGWAAAEVSGGDAKRLADVSKRMDQVFDLR